MKFFLPFLLLAACTVNGQRQTENIIIITTDGFRWQEVFKGMDSAIANNSKNEIWVAVMGPDTTVGGELNPIAIGSKCNYINRNLLKHLLN